MKEEPIVVDIYGDMACFTRPDAKVERLSYQVPTPSALRGVLSAIYSKPVEFYWQIRKIEIIKPIRYISFMRNEVKNRASKTAPILVEEVRTQRNATMLRDVYYRVTADMVKRSSFQGTSSQLYAQARNRISHGKCFYQPCLGTRECVCYFEEPNLEMQPIDLNMDLGLMLYDVFDLDKFTVEKKATPSVSMFYAKIEHGVIDVPEFHSDQVIRPREDVPKC